MNPLRSLASRLSPLLLLPPVLLAQADPPGESLQESLKSAEAWALTLEAALRDDRPDEVEDFLDFEAIMDAAIEGWGTSEKDRVALEDFRAGMESSVGTMESSLWSQWRSQPKLKQVLLVEGELSARFRFCDDDGISIIDMRLRRDGRDWRVVDIFNHAFGLGMVDELRNTAALMLENQNAGWIARVLGGKGISQRDLSYATKMAEKCREGDFRGAIAAHAKLKGAIKETPMVTAAHIQALSMVEEEVDAYLTALEDAAKRFPAPQFRLSLIDAHILKGNWDAAVACIDECMDAIGRDAALLSTRALIELQANRNARGVADMEEALLLEPECEFAVANGLDIWLAVEDWAAVARALSTLESIGDYNFKGSLFGEEWAGFRAAPESEPWR